MWNDIHFVLKCFNFDAYITYLNQVNLNILFKKLYIIVSSLNLLTFIKKKI